MDNNNSVIPALWKIVLLMPEVYENIVKYIHLFDTSYPTCLCNQAQLAI